jgi:TPR repeat protein
LGVLLSNGNGVRKNVKEALVWLRKAFRAGDSCARHNIAVTYREKGDLKTAVKWFRNAAEADDHDALIQLGIHYYWGKGVRKNPRAVSAPQQKQRTYLEGEEMTPFSSSESPTMKAAGCEPQCRTPEDSSNEQT